MNTTEKTMNFTTPPVLIATWPGPGNVGTMVLDYLRYKFDAEWVASLDMSSLFSPSAVPIREGKLMSPAVPRGDFYFKQNPSVILFRCDTNFAERESIALVNYLVDKAREWKVSRIFTVGAVLIPMDHNQLSELRFAASGEQVAGELETHGFKPISNGELSGPVALVPTIAGGANMMAACILATMPAYAGTIAYPQATLEILKGLESLLNFQIDLTQLEDAITKMEGTFELLENHVREYLPFLLSSNNQNMEEEAEEPPEENREAPADEVPLSAKITIDRLFEEAARDMSKIGELKKELDRWDVFKQFEDRFLDLFKKPDAGE